MHVQNHDVAGYHKVSEVDMARGSAGNIPAIVAKVADVGRNGCMRGCKPDKAVTPVFSYPA
jgi:hypothetical protein